MTHDEMVESSRRSAGVSPASSPAAIAGGTPALRDDAEDIQIGDAFMDRYRETFRARAK